MLLNVGRENGFRSEIDFENYLRPLSLDNDLWPKHLEHFCNVGAFMRWGGNGYKLGIRVGIEWWEKMRALCPAVLYEDSDHLCGCVNLTLAILPYREFGMYWDPVEWEGDYSEKLWAEINEARKKHQWLERKEPDSDFAHLEPKAISHRYFDLRHNSI
jgi:hypothetical protein